MRCFAIFVRMSLVPIVALSCGGNVVVDVAARATGAGGGGAPSSTATSSPTIPPGVGGSMTAAAGGAGGSTASFGGAISCSGFPTCNSNLDCPPLGTVCLWWACIEGCCATFDTAQGTPCAENGGTVCDGGGHCVGP